MSESALIGGRARRTDTPVPASVRLRRLAKRAEPVALGAFAAALRLRGRDVTAQTERASALVLAPHPDDETLGCGATIMRKVHAGRPVRVIFATDGRHSHCSTRISPDALAAIRREEAVSACRVLGVDAGSVLFLDYEDGRLGDYIAAAQERVLAVIREFGPGEIYVPCGIDRHADHRALRAVVASLMRDGQIHCPVYEYPIWFFSALSWTGGRGPRFAAAATIPARMAAALLRLSPRLVRTAGYLDRKRTALAEHATQCRGLPGEPGSASLDPRFVAQFLGPYEMFFRMGVRSRRWREDPSASTLREQEGRERAHA